MRTPSGLAPPDVLISPEPKVLARTIDDETVLYVERTQRILVLDHIGTALWNRVRTPELLSRLCDALAADFGTDAATVASDLHQPIGLLVESGALRAEALAEPSP